jgi:hypothetical protein
MCEATEQQLIIKRISNNNQKNDKEIAHNIYLPSSVQQCPTLGESKSPFH